jgi:phosphatidylcholine synthase
VHAPVAAFAGTPPGRHDKGKEHRIMAPPVKPMHDDRDGILSPLAYGRAFAVHVFTAAGAALALGAMIYAVRGEWVAMLVCLGIALFIDGIDGAIARRVRVAEVLPRWSGDVLDLVVDFVTYVFVPAYAVAAGGLLPDLLAVPAGIVIVVTGALYFADKDMKTADNYFRGFPALWNAAVFYLFVVKLPPWLAAAVIAALAVLTFVPFKFVHPMRVRRLRPVNIAALLLWSVLALVALWHGLDPGPWVAGGLVAVALYLIGVGLTEKTPT